MEEQDAHEMLHVIMTTLEEEIPSKSNNNKPSHASLLDISNLGQDDTWHITHRKQTEAEVGDVHQAGRGASQLSGVKLHQASESESIHRSGREDDVAYD